MNVRRVFVGPPFRACPTCGAEQEGVLSVGERSYTRECLGCRATRAIDLPPVSKHAIYLDQFVISNVAKLLDTTCKSHVRVKADSFWTEFYGALGRLVTLQLAACPSSLHQMMESMVSEDPSYQSLRDVYEYFSGGLSLPGHQDILSAQAAALLVAQFDGAEPIFPSRGSAIEGCLDGWVDRARITVSFGRPAELVEGSKAELKQAEDAWTRIAERWRTSTETYEETREAEARDYGPALWRSWMQYQMSLLQADPNAPAALFLPPAAAYTIVQLQEVLRWKGVDGGKQLEVLAAFLHSPGFAKLPYVKWQSGLFAGLARRLRAGQKRTPSRGTFTDVEMIASLLPHCDAMFLDKEMASLLDEEPLRTEVARLGVSILSLRDRPAVLRYLTDIEAQARAEHVALVKDVYGESCLDAWMERLDGERNRRDSEPR